MAGIFSAARVWWNFRLMGKTDVAVLDGGMPKWRAEGREIELGLRPEWISTEAGPGSVPFDARVELIEPTGPDIYAMLEAAGQSLVAWALAAPVMPVIET